MAKMFKKKKTDKEVIEDAKIIEEIPNADAAADESAAEEEVKKPSEFDNIKEKAKDFAHDVGEKSKEVAHTIGEKAPEVADAVVEKAKDIAHEVGERAPGVADTVFMKTKQFANTVAEKTEEAVNYGKLKLRLHNQRGQLNKAFSELGKLTYDLLKKKSDIPADEAVKEAVKTINSLKKDITATEKEIEEIGHHPEEETGKGEAEGN